MNIEIEYKVLINKDDFEKIEKVFDKENCNYYIQKNNYFDTPNLLLKSNKLSLRIRHIESKNLFIVTLKDKIKDGHIEYEYNVFGDSFNDIPKEIIDILINKGIETKNIIKLAELKTIRKEYHYKEGLLCLDHNFYYGKEDYEIEFESNDLKCGEEIVTSLLNNYGITFVKNTKSKIARAIESKRDSE